MFRTPIPNEDLARLESLTTDELAGLFTFCLKGGSRAVDYSLLAGAWGAFFSRLFLTGQDLIDRMQGDKTPLAESHERVLREFIREDCRKGGPFVLNVIRNGGTIDRAALIMIAEPGDLAGVGINGSTAIHLLAVACDRAVRPAFIRRTGSTLLSTVYDARGLPVLYTIFGLGDLSMADLAAIESLFSKEELKKVMCRNRTGRDALTVFSEIYRSLQSHESLDRHPFFRNHGRKARDGMRMGSGQGSNGPESDVRASALHEKK